MTEIPRDRWSRPLIIPADGGDPVAYVRTSTLAKSLDELIDGETQRIMSNEMRKTISDAKVEVSKTITQRAVDAAVAELKK